MTGRGKVSVGSTLLGVRSRWCSLVGRGRSLGGRFAARCGGGPAGLSRATRDRVIDLIEGDLGCLIDDASEKPIAAQSVDEMLLNREVLVWLRGGPLPGQGAVELLEENVAVFYRAPAKDEQANGKALRAALDEVVRARAAARAAGPCEGAAASSGPTERERRRFGKRLDELRAGKNMTIGELSARSGIDVVRIVALTHGADEAGASEMMSLAAALEAPPHDLFPECLAGPEDEEGRGCPGGERGDA